MPAQLAGQRCRGNASVCWRLIIHVDPNTSDEPFDPLGLAAQLD
ncbi:MAG: hypothetical protein RMJ90_02055 [Candidatus Bipolaricaulota bacterium]|nr:hypothetical protein [Candidatus Bipolaricaulota bacterium]